jgi:hypothetical protein
MEEDAIIVEEDGKYPLGTAAGASGRSGLIPEG